MNLLLTVCGRGGSKGVKDKNIRLINGKPLIAYTLEVAKKWGKADIICSSDSDKILDVAKTEGVKIIKRPNELATSTSGKLPVIRHALVESEKLFSKKYDLIIDLDITSPIRTTQDLDNCLELYNKGNCDVLFSVTQSRKNPYFNMIERTKEGKIEISKKGGFLRRQDAPEVYDMNASIYFYNPNFLIDQNNVGIFTAQKKEIYVMDEISSIDIDNEMDFKIIEFLINERVINFD